jgi:hypothetical protein
MLPTRTSFAGFILSVRKKVVALKSFAKRLEPDV